MKYGFSGRKNDPAAASFAIAIRRLREALREGDRSQTRSLLITSALPGEGKTMLALNLALAAAAGGERVLLVDGDLTGRTLTNMLESGKNPGLLDLIEKRTILSAALISATETGLSFLPAGTATSARLPVRRGRGL